MTDATPQEPYEIDDRVRIRLADADAEIPYEGTICRVVQIFADGPDADTGTEPERKRDGKSDREIASVAYRLEDEETGETLPIVPHHRDLRPVADGE